MALPAKLRDCRSHSRVGTELLIVEGDSAGAAVAANRNQEFQAVLPLQGKPLNPVRAHQAKVLANATYQMLMQSIGTGVSAEFEFAQCRYERFVLLFDADADGIHASSLVLMFFYQWMRPLLDAGKIVMVRAPLLQVTYDGMNAPLGFESVERATQATERLIAEGKQNVSRKYFRGLGSIDPPTLRYHCIDPKTRNDFVLGASDAEEAIAIFNPRG